MATLNDQLAEFSIKHTDIMAAYLNLMSECQERGRVIMEQNAKLEAQVKELESTGVPITD